MQKIRFPQQLTPRWIWFAVEQLLVALCFYVAASVTGWFTVPALLLNTVTAIALAFYFDTFTGIVRYTGIGDIRRVVKFAFGLMLVWWLAFISHSRIGFLHGLPFAFPLVNASLLCFIDTGSRLLVKKIYTRLSPRGDRSWKSRMYHVEELTAITIRSLLQREEIVFQNEQTPDCFTQKVVLISGAAGSIGSEICRQLFQYPLRRIILLDQSESGLFDFELELRSRDQPVEISVEVASVRDKQRIEAIFTRYRPDFVFHAAAYKHVPVMETLPGEAILTNVWGTRIMADAAVRTGTRKFIMVSSDKAVNPSTIMGATKSIAEIYIQSLSGQSGNTRFITTRFGNVLGSTGSVVPLFIRQILNGGPVTVTHPEVTRYFMTIPEASRLVIEACVMGQGGEVFVFNMGEPVRILEMARQLIRLAGYTPQKEIAIKFIGLRQGEKIHEELFNPAEHLMPTHHPRIMKASTRDLDTTGFRTQLDQLIEAAAQHRQDCARELIAAMVPDFKPQQL
jgi:FlaA1/EpsC-like NDP-sugar epimerase